MELKLKKLKLLNFKGIKELEIEVDSDVVNIYGANETGKTTVYDSIYWLLFDKNSQGKKDFGIKTLDAAGEPLHNLEHSVEGTFIKDGKPITLKKIYYEKWTRKRGSATAEFSGHVTDYYVDDFPKKKSEYEAMISSITKEDIFKLLTDPLYFNEKMDWKDRRKTLIDICGDVDDEMIINSNPDLIELKDLCNGNSVEDLRIKIQSKMKPLNDELSKIPVQINEAELAKPKEYQEIDENEIQSLRDEIAKKESELIEIRNGSIIIEKQAKIERLKKEQNELMIPQKSNDMLQAEREITECIHRIEANQNTIKMMEIDINYMESQKVENEKNMIPMREEWKKINETEFDATDLKCPTCNQPLPEDKVDEAREEFNKNKVEKLSSITSKGKLLKEQNDHFDEHIKSKKEKIDNANEEIKKAEAELETLKNKKAELEREEFQLSTKRIEELSLEIRKLQDEVDQSRTECDPRMMEVNECIQNLRNKVDALLTLKSSHDTVLRQEKRIEELKERENLVIQEYQKYERQLFITEQFIREKVRLLTESINSHFKMANFKLFETQINGGLKECCEVTYKGVNYANLNSAARINIGLDIINTICEKHNANVPIVIDNAESVNKLIETKSQQIRMYVSEDKQLRIEKEN